MSSAAPHVTVLMSVFNGGRFLDAAVASIRAQTFCDFEFIIINDGSTDGSAECLEKHAEEDSRLHIIHQKNQGLIAALNHGLSKARASLVARMDSDDVALPDRLAKQVLRMDEELDLVLLGGHIQIIDGRDEVGPIIRFPVGNTAVQQTLYYGSPVAHPSAIMRVAPIRDVGGYRAFYKHCEDYDLWLRLSEKGRIDNLDEVVLRYRQHGSNVSSLYRETQLIGTFLAQAAWLVRRSGRPDPTDSWHEIDRDTLRELPLSEEDRWMLRCRWTLLAVDSLGLGDYWRARQLMIELGRKPGRLDDMDTNNMARINAKLALLAARERQWALAVRHATASFRYSPKATMRSMLRRIHVSF